MSQCAAVKRRGVVERCSAMSLRGHTLCGRHARLRYPILWADTLRDRTSPLIKIQSVVRGWLVRKRLSYAGPGVLSRKDLMNDEDIITYTEKHRVHPMEFFSFEENGKIWWFEFASLWTWMMRTRNPINPYTKSPLTTDTRKRLRAIWAYKKRHGDPLPPESIDYQERLQNRIHVLIQHFTDYGFADVSSRYFHELTRSDYVTMFTLFAQDLDIIFPTRRYPGIERIQSLCNGRIRNANHVSPHVYILQSITTLLYILTFYKDPYLMTFTVLSAFYRT